MKVIGLIGVGLLVLGTALLLTSSSTTGNNIKYSKGEERVDKDVLPNRSQDMSRPKRAQIMEK